MLTTKILSILTLILMPVANVSIVTASQDSKDGYNTNMSDTLKLSDELLSLSLSDSSDSNANSDAEEENNSKITVTTTIQQSPFQCDISGIEDAEEQSQDPQDNGNGSFIDDAEVIVGYMSSSKPKNETNN